MDQSTILSFASYFPNQMVSTTDFLNEARANRYDISEKYIQDEIGIKTVHHCAAETKPSALAGEAARLALQKSGLHADQIDHIFFTGIEGDYIEPSTAHQVQKMLGGKALCFDIKNACLGFMSAIYSANALITSNAARYVLICTGEKNSALTHKAIRFLQSVTDPITFKNTLGFLTIGDSGGAMILGPRGEGHALLGFEGLSNGRQSRLCHYNYDAQTGEFVGEMQMARICSTIIGQHHKAYNTLLPKLDWTQQDIDYCIVHQVGEPPMKKFAEKLGLDYAKLTESYREKGNLTTNTLAANLSLYEDKFNKGDKVYFAMSGSGTSVQHAGMIFS